MAKTQPLSSIFHPPSSHFLNPEPQTLTPDVGGIVGWLPDIRTLPSRSAWGLVLDARAHARRLTHSRSAVSRFGAQVAGQLDGGGVPRPARVPSRGRRGSGADGRALGRVPK